eukprot:TCONS_00022164-protein
MKTKVYFNIPAHKISWNRQFLGKKMAMAGLTKSSKCVPKFGKIANFRVISQSYSVNTVQNVDVELIETAEKVEKGVPFLFLPHTVKKAYNVKSGVTTSLPQVFDKYKWLTKTLSSPNIPEDILSNNESNFDEFKLLLHDSLAQTTAFQKTPKNKDDKRFRQERMVNGIFSNFLRLSMVKNNSKAHLKPGNFYLLNKTQLESHWVRNYKFYQTQIRPTYTLKTQNPLAIIEEPNEIHPLDIERIPGPFDPYAMNLYRHPVVHLTSRPALDNSRYSQYHHCHTSIAINNRLRTDEQIYSLGMFTMFAQLSAQAQANGVLQGTNLDQPLVTQCIVSNGHLISFMMYQLNTLNMLTDKGVWNRCWYTPSIGMFEQNNEASHGRIYEEALPQDILEGFNDELPKHFHAFIGNETV